MTKRLTAVISALALVPALASPVWAQTADQAAPKQAAASAAGPEADPYRDQRPLPTFDPNDPAAREAWLRARGEAYHRAPDTAQTEEELRTTRALNDEISAQNNLAQQAETQANLDYEAALDRREAEIMASRERARADAEAVREAQRQYDRDYAAWREQVRLCQSGRREACTARPAYARQ